MILDKRWRIVKSGESFNLVNKVNSKDKDGNPKMKDVVYYYGTLYQALQAYLTKKTESYEYESISELSLMIGAVLSDIMKAKEEIKNEFCTEVRKC